jgi:hypothetical protein
VNSDGGIDLTPMVRLENTPNHQPARVGGVRRWVGEAKVVAAMGVCQAIASSLGGIIGKEAVM